MIQHIPLQAYGQAVTGIRLQIGATVYWDFACLDPDSREPLDLSAEGIAVVSSLCARDVRRLPTQPPKISRQGTITDAPHGLVTVPWASGDTAPTGAPLDPGLYLMDLWLTDIDGNRRSLIEISVELQPAETLPTTLVAPLPEQPPLGQGPPGTIAAGLVAFAAVGSGAGVDYVDVAISPTMTDTSYKILLTAELTDSDDPAPTISARNKSTTGFRIRTDSHFGGNVSWAVLP